MKSTLIYATLLSLASAAAIDAATELPVPPRQFIEPYLRMLQAPAMKKNNSNEATGAMHMARMRTDSKFIKMRYGPYQLPAGNKYSRAGIATHEKGSKLVYERVIPPCADCMILQGKTYLEYANGTEAGVETGVYNHHAVVLNNSKKQRILMCPGGHVQQTPMGPGLVVGAAVDTSMQYFTTADAGFKSGYYMKPKVHTTMMAELMNYRLDPQQVYVTVEVEYVPGTPAGYMDVVSIPISVADCAKPEFKVLSPQYSKVSGELTIPTDSYIVYMMGHTHDGGSSVTFKVNQNVVCDSMAIYSNSTGTAGHMGGKGMGAGGVGGTITEMSGCGSKAVQLHKGDKLTVAANFDTVKHPMRMSSNGKSEGVMGLGVVKFAYPLNTKFF